MAVYEHGIEAKAGAVIGSPKSSAAPLPTDWAIRQDVPARLPSG